MAAGYSKTPLAKKLGIKAGHRVGLFNAPDGFEETLGALPETAVCEREPAEGALDVALLFARDFEAMAESFGALHQRLAPAGGLWVAWPKKSSKVPTDLRDQLVREHGLAHGLVDNKVCAIDATWSGLRFVIRLRDR